jgi:hypothetical protein
MEFIFTATKSELKAKYWASLLDIKKKRLERNIKAMDAVLANEAANFEAVCQQWDKTFGAYALVVCWYYWIWKHEGSPPGSLNTAIGQWAKLHAKLKVSLSKLNTRPVYSGAIHVRIVEGNYSGLAEFLSAVEDAEQYEDEE